MASERQIAANRRNAARSTGPRTARGKLRSRRNAYRHGLTAETVITSLESTSDYQRLEAGLFDEYQPHGAVEEALVARLASLLWRLQRATLIETGLFEMQGAVVQQQDAGQHLNPALSIFYGILSGANVRGLAKSDTAELRPSIGAHDPPIDTSSERRRNLAAASTYLRLCRKNPAAMKRLGRYETALWRQVAQTLLMLDSRTNTRFPMSRIVSN